MQLSATEIQNTTISFKETGYFSKLICDYLDQKKTLKPLYQNFSNIAGFEKQIELKQSDSSNNAQSRLVLVEALKTQYKNTATSKKTGQNIQSLLNNNTFTVTTGHQLNLFTGPLYFLYKIITVINISKTLKKAFPDKNFVPVYWMATEDHDFERFDAAGRGNQANPPQRVGQPVVRVSDFRRELAGPP